MQPANPEYREHLKVIFGSAPFIQYVGYQLIDFGPGWCETMLAVRPEHLQQNRFIHAGVQATMADHTSGGAAATLVQSSQVVLTVEFKINLLRPAVGEWLRCRGTVLKPGRTLSVCESEVFTRRQQDDLDSEKLVAKATVTIAVVDQSYAGQKSSG